MVYVGSALAAAGGHRGSVEPALIDSRLKVDWSRPALRGEGMTYWPSYSGISPANRAAYLGWLAGGRQDPDAYIGYVFLFFYGLERRMFIDAQGSTAATAEVPIVVAEVERLLGIYGANSSFRGYALSFLDAVQAAFGVAPAGPPSVSVCEEWALPLGLRLEVGRMAMEGRPLPAEWELAWVRLDPTRGLRTPATRCAVEFEELFRHYYRDRFGDGIVIKPNKTKISVSYRLCDQARCTRPASNARLFDLNLNLTRSC